MIVLKIVILVISLLTLACQLVDNGINGSYESVQPTLIPTEINLKLNQCYTDPPEALYYTCQIDPVYSYNSHENILESDGEQQNSQKINYVKYQEQVSYELVNNTCLGLSIGSSGYIEGQILNTEAESCSLSVRATVGSLSVEETTTFSIAPSINFSFDQDNIFIKEGMGAVTVLLVLSVPAPYDTFVEIEIYGDQSETLNSSALSNKRIAIVQGQTSVSLDLSVAPAVTTNSVNYKHIALVSGSTQELPGVSVSLLGSGVTPPSFEQVATGKNHTCGIDDGELYCWGGDTFGQVGNGSIEKDDVIRPLQVSVLTSWSQISAGGSHSCGIAASELYCWGEVSSGQQGNGTTSGSVVSVPTQVGAMSLWLQVATGDRHTCGIESGNLYCWGNDYSEQVGNGAGVGYVTVPTAISLTGTWSMVSAGWDHSCGIDAGKLYCWGKDDFGQMGNGSLSNSVIDTPSQIGSLSTWQLISAGGRHSCGIENGKLFCWGSNVYGETGNGSPSTGLNSPVQVGDSGLWTAVSLGDDHSCGIEDGNLYCWGSDRSNQIGNGTVVNLNANNSVPNLIASSDDWTEVAAGVDHSCGINSLGLFCWGSGDHGRSGTGLSSAVSASQPEQVGGSTSWSDVSTGSYHVCGIDGGKVFCWGSNFFGQIGNDGPNYIDVATPKLSSISKKWTAIATGGDHSCGVNLGYLFCWGSDADRQLGHGNPGPTQYRSPNQIGMLSNWEKLSAGGDHTCALNLGKLYCWGRNSYGQIGNGNASSVDIQSPLQIGVESNWSFVSAGEWHTCGIKGGEIYCWGRNAKGQVGDGVASSVNVTTPSQVGSSSLWSHVVAGGYHSCGINSGELFCWGSDAQGQMGDGSASSSNVLTPFKINSSVLWTSVAAGLDHTCGVENGSLYCWGFNRDFQIGILGSSASNYEDPIQVGSSNTWTKVSGGDTHTCGINGGKMFCWGSNNLGQVGVGTSLLGEPFLILEKD